jgi:hypothetical protein
MGMHSHDRGDQERHGGMNHGMGMMLLSCGVPIAALLLLPLTGIRLSGTLSTLLILVCPLSHVLMMVFMGKEHGHGAHVPATAVTKEPVPEVIDDEPRMLLPAPRERG